MKQYKRVWFQLWDPHTPYQSSRYDLYFRPHFSRHFLKWKNIFQLLFSTKLIINEHSFIQNLSNAESSSTFTSSSHRFSRSYCKREKLSGWHKMFAISVLCLTHYFCNRPNIVFYIYGWAYLLCPGAVSWT